MGSEINRRRCIQLLSSLALVAESAAADVEPVAIIVPAGSSQKQLSMDNLRRIFLNNPTNNDEGERFIAINHRRGSDPRVRFDRAVLNLSPTESERYWIDQRLRGKKPPITAPSIAVIRRAMRELGGAISYLPLSLVDSSMAVLRIDGKSPTDAGYALR